MKKILIVIFVTMLFSANACTEQKSEESKISQIYCAALEELMPINEHLYKDVEFIVINTKTLKDASDSDKKTILKYFEKYNEKVIDESMDTPEFHHICLYNLNMILDRIRFQ